MSQKANLLKHSKKRGFRIRIIEIFVILTLLTTFGLSFLFYYRATDIILDLSDQLAQEVTSKVIERTENYVGVPAKQAQVLSNLVTQSNIMAEYQEIWKYAWEQLLVFSQIQAIFVADNHGSYVQVRREPDYATRYIDRSGKKQIEKWWFRDRHYNVIREQIVENPTFDPRTRPWFRNTRAIKDIYWTDVYVFTTAKTPGISASYPILDAQGKQIGVTCINSPLHSLSAFLSQQKVSKNSVIFITNKKNELIAYPNGEFTSRIDSATGEYRLSYVNELSEQWITDAFEHYRTRNGVNGEANEVNWAKLAWARLREGSIPSIQELFHYPKRKFSVSNTEGKNYITYAAPFPMAFASEWELIIVLPEEDLILPLQELRQTGLLTAIVFLLFSILIIYLIVNSLTKSIIRLAEETKKISQFNLDEIDPVSSNIREVDIMSKALISATNGLQSFKKYVPASLVRQLIEVGKEVKLGGEEANLTILFSDIQNFTMISEKMTPDDLMSHLSEYLTQLSKIIMDSKGTIDKYIGDAIMAFWGAPVAQENSPYLGCKAALDCQKLLTALNAKWISEGKSPLITRIGIHSGKTVVGNLGSNDRMNYTIIGHSTNLASRLEGINKLYGTRIIISEDTYRRVSEHFFCRLLDFVSVKGQVKSYRIYELIDELKAPLDERVRQFCQRYENGFQSYLQRDWDQALAIFKALQEDFPQDLSVQLLYQRCVHFQQHPELLEKDWDGAYHLTEK